MNNNLSTINEVLFLGTDSEIPIIDKIDKKIVVVFELEKERILKERGIETIYFNRQAQK